MQQTKNIQKTQWKNWETEKKTETEKQNRKYINDRDIMKQTKAKNRTQSTKISLQKQPF